MPRFIFPRRGRPDGRSRLEALRRLHREGFAPPGELMQAADGAWKGSSVMNGRVVHLTIDHQGTVIAVPA
ncbi:MAG: hypothetical protein IT562_23425 [Alphaproteobacteria bacterium]|nr:hypothetical protein [Alphaproteobacteria bacterium]